MKRELLRLENVVCQYNQVTVLNGFRLRVFQGEILGMLTMSELERTALFQLMNGTLIMSNGQVWFNETSAPHRECLKSKESGICCIDRTASLIPSLNVVDNIILFDQVDAPFRWIKGRENSKSVAPLLQKMNITALTSRDIRSLTFFERLKVRLCRVLWEKAAIIVMEDCFSLCNEREKADLEKILRTLNKEGVSCVLLGHDAADLVHRSDRLIIVQSGMTVLNVNSPVYEKDIRPILTALVGGTIDQATLGSESGGNAVMVWKNVRTESVKSLSFRIHAGEIAALLDTDHSVNDFVADILRGRLNYEGRITAGNTLLDRHISPYLRRKSVFLVPEDPRLLTIPVLSPLENILLAIQKDVGRQGFISPRIVHFLGEELQELLSLDRRTFNRALEMQSEVVQFTVAFQMLRFYRPNVAVVQQPGILLPERSRRDLIQTLSFLTREGCGILLLISSFTGIGRMAKQVYIGAKGRIVS